MQQASIDGYPAWPIARISVKFPIDLIQDLKHVRRSPESDLPHNRRWTLHSLSTMQRHVGFSHGEAYAAAIDLFEHARSSEQYEGLHPGGDPIIKIRFEGYETWMLSWFQHETIDVGLSDREILDSFERYVWRKRTQKAHAGRDESEGLMGAEDRWRWCGAGDDGAPDTRTSPPCRCRHCRSQGVVRIGH